MNEDEELDQAVADWLARREDDPRLLPGTFAAGLPEALRSAFLRELESLAELDRLTTGASPRDLPLRFGDFRVLGELGRGAMGAVYAAEQISLGRRVALKVMHPHVADDLRSAARFQREARTAASLVHPGIVPVLGFGQQDDFAWLAMGLVEGRSLQRLLQAVTDPRDVDHVRARRWLDDPRSVAQILADAADALEFAHRKNVVHRDVKPANLMLGDDGRIVVLDFGLATARDAEAPTLTQTGDFLGTPLYMAPEQARGAQNGTAQSDVYSLGAVLYECLCQRPPVAPGPLPTVLDAILNRDPIDPRRVRQGVAPELAHIALKCLEKVPQRRYATAADFADDLRRFVDGSGVRARGTGVVRQLTRHVQRRPLGATLAAASLLLLPTVLWAWHRGDQAATLQASADLDRARDLLALSPEGITVFGGASQRFYRQLGLGEYLPSSVAPLTPNAAEALRIVERLARERPDDAMVQRSFARVLLDIGNEPARIEAALEALTALPDAAPADRAMLAVWQQQRGSTDESLASSAFAATGSPEVEFWHALWHQHRQDYFAAIAAFDRALAAPALGRELRYFALLHRGWCKTCPDVCRVREAADDLLQAAALRPEYGTARLLWAALCCLDPNDDLSRPVAAVGEVLGAVKMEPWVVVLTARVLLALAEGGIWQAGPVHFGAELSPIAGLPLPPGRGEALAKTALGLLDAVLADHADAFEARWHRITALALLGRHDAALGECARLENSSNVAYRAAAWIQQARVQLAAGRAQLALQAADRALTLDDRLVAAWRFRADVAAWLGDLAGELTALERAVRYLSDQRQPSSVFPDAAVVLPELQLRRAARLTAAGRLDEADELLQHGDFGGVLAGELSPRIRMLRQAQRRELQQRRGSTEALAAVNTPDLPADSPLQLLANDDRPVPALSPAAQAAGLFRAWATEESVAGASPGDAAWAPARLELLLARAASATAGTGNANITAELRRRAAAATDITPGSPFSSLAVLGAFSRGDELPDASALPLGVLLPHLPELLKKRGTGDRLLAIADRQIALDADNGEARLVRAATLYFLERFAETVAFLDADLDRHPDDLRARYVQAAAAIACNQPVAAERALSVHGARLLPAALDCAREAVRAPFPLDANALLALLR